jgi:hypothetical protein
MRSLITHLLNPGFLSLYKNWRLKVVGYLEYPTKQIPTRRPQFQPPYFALLERLISKSDYKRVYVFTVVTLYFYRTLGIGFKQ